MSNTIPNELPGLAQKNIIDKTIIDIETVLKFYGKSITNITDQERLIYFEIYQKGMIAAIEHARGIIPGEEEKETT